jgi:hypothetical protein
MDLARYPTSVAVVCHADCPVPADRDGADSLATAVAVVCHATAVAGLPHRQTQPLRAPAVSPPVMNRWKMRNKTTIGILLIRLAPISWFQ